MKYRDLKGGLMQRCTLSFCSRSSLEPSYDAVRRTGWSNNMHSGKGEAFWTRSSLHSVSLFNNTLFFSNVLKCVCLSTGSPVVAQNVSKSAEQPRPQPGIDLTWPSKPRANLLAQKTVCSTVKVVHWRTGAKLHLLPAMFLLLLLLPFLQL